MLSKNDRLSSATKLFGDCLLTPVQATFCFSGNNGGKLKKFVQYPIIFKSKETDILQVVEIAIGQIYCSILEDYFLKKEKIK